MNTGLMASGCAIAERVISAWLYQHFCETSAEARKKLEAEIQMMVYKIRELSEHRARQVPRVWRGPVEPEQLVRYAMDTFTRDQMLVVR